MENEHIVARFDRDLKKIKTVIQKMGALVNAQIKGATDALMDGDTAEIDHLVATDRRINRWNMKVRDRAQRLIALRQPVALDLREALLAIQIAGELERMGDHAKTTAKRVRRLSEGSSGRDALNAIGEMSAGVQDMLTEVLIAYEAGNIDLAAEIRDRDHEIDTLNNRVLAQATAAIRENPGDVETLVQMIILGRNFERAGDHVVNIARQVHQIVTGQDPKQWD